MTEERTAYGLSDWQGYLTHAEIDWLKDLASMLPPRPVIVNIGAGAGTSTLSFLEARKDAVVFSIDIKVNESEVTTNEHLRLKEVSPDKSRRVIKIWGDSKVVGNVWPFLVDMVFVDGDHSKAGVVGDITGWMDKIKTGGIIAFDDYGSTRWPDVQREVNKWLSDYEVLGAVGNVKAFKV